jgi:hypothetical protein
LPHQAGAATALPRTRAAPLAMGGGCVKYGEFGEFWFGEPLPHRSEIY